MRSYSVRDVERVLQLAPDSTRSLIRAGFVHPARGPRRVARKAIDTLDGMDRDQLITYMAEHEAGETDG